MANGCLLKVLSTIAYQNSCGMRSKPINPNSLDLRGGSRVWIKIKKIFRGQSHFLKNAFTVKISYEKFSVVRITMRIPKLKYNTLTKFPALSIKGYRIIFLSVFWNDLYRQLNPLSANPTKRSNTLEPFVGKSQRIIWVCLTILWGWHLKG